MADPSRDPVMALASALERDPSGIAIVYYPDPGLREWITAQVESIAGPDAHALRVATVDEAIAVTDRLVVVTPLDEVEDVLDLNALRDRVLNAKRRFPVVLMLLRDGAGHRALTSEAPGLWSVIKGSDPDPDRLAEVDVVAERVRFEADHGQTPDAWLAAWRAGSIATSAEALAVAYQAMLLESDAP